MEASTSGIPAAAEAQPSSFEGGAETVQPSPTVVPEQPVAPSQPAPTEDNPVLSQLQEMRQTLDGFAQRLPEQAASEPASLVDALLAEDAGDGLSPEEVAAYDAQQGGQIAENPDQALAELDAYVQEKVQAAINPLVQERQTEQLNALQEQYPDILTPEVWSQLEPTLQSLAGRYGDEVKSDPNFVRTCYLAVKAQMADAAAVPAETAASNGASIETQAGQSQTGETSEADEYANALLGGGTPSAFEL